MAVPPPFDKLTSLPGKAVNKLTAALNKLVSYLKKLIHRLLEKAGLLPNNIKCTDPRVLELKQLLVKIKATIDRVRNVLLIMTTVVTVLQIAITIASASLGATLLIPLPLPPGLAQFVNVLNTLIPNIISAVKQLSITLPIITAAVAGISIALGTVINLLGSICINETFSVDSNTLAGMTTDIDNKLKDETFSVDSNTLAGMTTDIDNKLKDIIQQYPSKFYRTINVSEQDIEQRAQLIEELVSRNHDVLSNILEAPSNVIIGNVAPKSDSGKLGDYFIDNVNQLIYGPKQTDFDWGMGLNY